MMLKPTTIQQFLQQQFDEYTGAHKLDRHRLKVCRHLMNCHTRRWVASSISVTTAIPRFLCTIAVGIAIVRNVNCMDPIVGANASSRTSCR
jgi:hypothetical protein